MSIPDLKMPTVLRDIVTQLRERKLWPLAVVLLLGIVAAPVVLARKAHSVPVAVAPHAGLPVSSAAPVPPVTVDNSPAHSRLTGTARDPFTPQAGSKPSFGVTSVGGGVSGAAANALHSAVGAGTTSTHGGAAGAATSTGASGGTGSPSTGAPVTPPSGPTPPPAPSGLSPTQAYDVALAITNSSGGLDTIDPLVRLHVFAYQQQALLVELGVLQGGNRVLFAVEPGAGLSGPGTCAPGPLDCEVLSLAPNQIETLSAQTSNGPVTVAMFAVTAIKAAQYPSAAAAKKARAVVDPAGRDVLSKSNLSALSLFQYEPNLGAVVDLRNLVVGGG
jgi:hypothetical protein